MDVTLVVSVYNEEDSLPAFLERVRETLDGLGRRAECILVDDGSHDRSAQIAGAAAIDSRFRLLRLSRNFGHEAAMIAGIDHARGDTIICLDADLQHPLEEIPRLLAARAQGYDVVTMAADEGGRRSGLRRAISGFFYRLLNAVSDHRFEPNASDFFLVSRRVADVLRREYRERVRFLRGYVQTVGFRKLGLRYAVGPRVHGRSKYSLRKLLDLSFAALLSFSSLPLRLGVLLGLSVGGLGTAVGVYSLVMKWRGDPPSGYTTIVVLLCFLFAVQFFLTGVIGEYLGYVYTEVKRRPIYIVDDEASQRAPDAP